MLSAFIDDAMLSRALGGARADLSTAARYLQLPAAKRPALSVYFDREFYAATNPDIRATGADPLLHFIALGIRQSRAPHPLIDLDYMRARDPSVLGDPPDAATLADLLDHDLTPSSPYLDLDYYASVVGAQAHPGGLLRHFLTEGLAAGRQPNAAFDPVWYATNHPDVPRDPYGALKHFVMTGDREARAPGPDFDPKFYRACYPDVVDAGVPPLRHFLTNGRREGRQPIDERITVGAPPAPAASLAVGSAIPIDATSAESLFEAPRARLNVLRQRQKDSVKVVPPPLIAVTTPREDLARIALPPAPMPRLSILIPVYNEFDYTVGCLLALARALPRHETEIVIADDGSSDPDMARLADIENIVYIRQPTNQGFIRNCNDAFARCRGEYVLLLNNDTQVLPDAIDLLVAALDGDPGLAAVGPKLIYPDGRLQEAGCALGANGVSVMVGLYHDPEEGAFRRDRDVAYCSGAALMLRRALAGDTLFDEAYRPAYCEDADLCLRLIAAGHRIGLVSNAVVVHFLSVSTNRQSHARKRRTVIANQQTLTERWGELLREIDRVRPIAFYLPQFHPTPENDFWWGSGFTEWTNVVKARPSYAGHYQPHLPTDLGFYDLRSPETLMRQAELAARYGIEGFCVYYYNFGGRRVLSRPIEMLRDHPEIPFRFCLCWANENWTRHWDGGDREILLAQSYDARSVAAVIGDAVAFAGDPRAIRVDGKPLFLVYRPLLIPDPVAFSAMCRAAFARAGFPGAHLVYVESMEAVDRGIQPADLGFDACVEFPPQGRAVTARGQAEILAPGWAGYRYDYQETVMSFLNRDTVPYARYPAVFPSWDNTPRQPRKGTSFENGSPEAFRFFVEQKLDEVRRFHMGDARLLFINAWNEWAEGAHLEPDTGYGHRWLEAFRDALDTSRYS